MNDKGMQQEYIAGLTRRNLIDQMDWPFLGNGTTILGVGLVNAILLLLMQPLGCVDMTLSQHHSVTATVWNRMEHGQDHDGLFGRCQEMWCEVTPIDVPTVLLIWICKAMATTTNSSRESCMNPTKVVWVQPLPRPGRSVQLVQHAQQFVVAQDPIARCVRQRISTVSFTNHDTDGRITTILSRSHGTNRSSIRQNHSTSGCFQSTQTFHCRQDVIIQTFLAFDRIQHIPNHQITIRLEPGQLLIGQHALGQEALCAFLLKVMRGLCRVNPCRVTSSVAASGVIVAASSFNVSVTLCER